MTTSIIEKFTKINGQTKKYRLTELITLNKPNLMLITQKLLRILSNSMPDCYRNLYTKF